MVLHGIDRPNIWHGNTLTDIESYGGLFQGAPDLFDVVLMNPPFGGREGADAQTKYAFRTTRTQVLFLQEVMNSLKHDGRAGIVVDEGLLFRINEKAFVQTKRKLLDECDLWCIVSLPSGVFTQAGAGVKTNLLFFNKGKPTQNIWYYDLSDVKVTKRKPLTRLRTSTSSSSLCQSARRASEAGKYPAQKSRLAITISRLSTPIASPKSIPAPRKS